MAAINFKISSITFLLSSVLLSVGSRHAGADWPQFRGPNASSVAKGVTLPLEFGGEESTNVVWKTRTPGKSVGGPIVVGAQVITTSSGGMDRRRIYLSSFNAEDGQLLWEQEFVARGRPFCHPTSANAAPTPCSNGQRVFAFYSSNDLVCVDLSGNLVWYRSLATDYPKAGNDTGMSSSPIVANGVVVVQIECQGDSFVAGLEAATGKSLWRIDRPRTANWASPLIVKRASGETLLVLQCRESLQGVDLQSGQEKWSLDLACSSVSSVSSDGERLYVPSRGMTAVELNSADQIPVIGWENNKLNSNSSSPVIYNDQVLAVNRSVLVSGNRTTGKLNWQLRLPDAGTIWATPVVADGRLFLFAESGKCFAVDLTVEQPEINAINEMGEDVLGSPAIATGAMFVRSNNALWKIATPE